MDVAAFLPHAPLRVYVMGDRGAANEDATADDIAEMARHVREAIEAGAVGVSSSRSLNHKDLDGEYVPGTFAAADELVGLAQAVVDAGGGLFEVVPQGETEGDADLILSEVELMGKVSQATDVPLSFLLVQSRLDPDLWRRQLELVDKVNANGARRHRAGRGASRRHAHRRRELPPAHAPAHVPAPRGLAPARRAARRAAQARGEGGDPRRGRPPARPAPPVRVARRQRAVPLGQRLPAR